MTTTREEAEIVIRHLMEGLDEIRKSETRIQALGGEADETSREVEELDRSLSELKAQNKLIDDFTKLKRQTQGAGDELDRAQTKAQALGRELAQAEVPTARLTERFNKARAAVQQKKQRLDSLRGSLSTTRKSLLATGVDTTNLSGAQRKNATQAKATQGRVDALNISLKRQADRLEFSAKNTRVATSELKSFGSTAQRASAQANKGFSKTRAGVQSISEQLRGAGNLIKGVFAARVAGGLINELRETADAAKELDGQLRQVTNTEAELTQRKQQLFEIAQETRGEFQATTELYARLRRNTDEQVASDEELLAVTGLVNKALKASGASSESAAAAVTQLNQGLASGVLRGEEFNSVAEQTPRLAQAIADGLGLTIGELREYAKQGKLTTETVINAIASQRASIEADFAATEQTIADSARKVGNSFLTFVDKFDDVTEASGVVAYAIDNISRSLDMLGDAIERAPDPAAALLEAEDAALRAAGRYAEYGRVALRVGEDLKQLTTDQRAAYQQQLEQTREAIAAEIKLAEVRQEQGYDQTQHLTALREQLEDVTTETERLASAEAAVGLGENGVSKLLTDVEALGGKLSELSAEDLSTLATQAQTAFDAAADQLDQLNGEFSDLEPRFAEMARQGSDAFQRVSAEAESARTVVEDLRVEGLRRLGIDAEELATGLSKDFRDASESVSTLLGPLGATGDVAAVAIEKVAGMADTVEEVEAAEAILAAAVERGAISAESARDITEQLRLSRADLTTATDNQTQSENGLSSALARQIEWQKGAAQAARLSKPDVQAIGDAIKAVGDKADAAGKDVGGFAASLGHSISQLRAYYAEFGQEATQTFDAIIERSYTYGQSVSTATNLANRELSRLNAQLQEQQARQAAIAEHEERLRQAGVGPQAADDDETTSSPAAHRVPTDPGLSAQVQSLTRQIERLLTQPSTLPAAASSRLEIVINLDGREIAREIYPHLEDIRRRSA